MLKAAGQGCAHASRNAELAEFLKGPSVRALAVRLSRDRALTGSIAAASIKAGGALLSLAVFTTAARTMGAGQFGTLAIWYNALSFMAVTAVFGQETLIVRSWGEYVGSAQFDLARGAYASGWRITLVSAALWGGVVWTAGLFREPGVPFSSVIAACAFLIGQTLLHYSSHSCRSIAGFVVSETNRELTWRVVLLGAALSVARSGLTMTEFFGAAAVGMALSIAFECVSVRRRFPTVVASATSKMQLRTWLSRSRAMWLSAVVEAASQYAEVVLLGLVTSPAVAGEYFVAARIANVFLMLGTGLHTYSIANAANMFFADEMERLQGVVRSVMTVAAAIMTPLLCALFLFAPRILLIFGQRYSEGIGTVLILSAACFIVSMTGPSPGILLITGFEKLYSRVIVAALVVRFALIVVLAQKLGAPGAALGWALANAPVSIGLAFVCRAKCGIDPSVLSILPSAPGRRKAATG